MSFINLIESLEGKFTSQCQDCRFVGVFFFFFFLHSFLFVARLAYIPIIVDFAVNYHSVS